MDSGTSVSAPLRQSIQIKKRYNRTTWELCWYLSHCQLHRMGPTTALSSDIQYIVQGDPFFKDLLRYLLAREGVYTPGGRAFLPHANQKVSYICGEMSMTQIVPVDFKFNVDKKK